METEKNNISESNSYERREKETKNKDIYKKWWFWLIILIIVIIIFAMFNHKTNSAKDVYSNDIKNDVSNSESEDKSKTNPYKVTNDYDGIYSFLLLDNNGSVNHQFNSVGAIKINNGKCKVKYKMINTDISDVETDTKYYGREYEGFCGTNEEDNESFYLLIKTGANTEIVYKCILSDNKLLGELKSEYNLSHCSQNKNLELIKVDGTNDINTVYIQTFEEEKARLEKEQKAKEEQEKKAFLSSCQTYTFEQMARNPNKFKGTNVKLTGEVVQVMSDSYSTNLRVNITKKDSYYTDTVYIVYHPEKDEDKILEEDIITIYGTSQGDCSYTTVMGTKVTLPNINAKYITIEK